MKNILLYSVLIVFCLIGCKESEQERYSKCQDIVDELQKHQLAVMDEDLRLIKIYRNAEDAGDSLKMFETKVKMKQNDELLYSIGTDLWNVRDSCHEIICVLKKEHYNQNKTNK